jgi:hypothetical protein
MISLDDCVALCGLTTEEVHAIGEHEHVPDVIAAALGSYLLHSDHGPEKIRAMIMDDIRDALHRGEVGRARELTAALRHFVAEHPAAALGPPG